MSSETVEKVIKNKAVIDWLEERMESAQQDLDKLVSELNLKEVISFIDREKRPELYHFDSGAYLLQLRKFSDLAILLIDEESDGNDEAITFNIFGCKKKFKTYILPENEHLDENGDFLRQLVEFADSRRVRHIASGSAASLTGDYSRIFSYRNDHQIAFDTIRQIKSIIATVIRASEDKEFLSWFAF